MSEDVWVCRSCREEAQRGSTCECGYVHPEERCDSVCTMWDDRWGGIQHLSCFRPRRHQGSHRHPLTACEPIAELAWVNPTNTPIVETCDHGNIVTDCHACYLGRVKAKYGCGDPAACIAAGYHNDVR